MLVDHNTHIHLLKRETACCLVYSCLQNILPGLEYMGEWIIRHSPQPHAIHTGYCRQRLTWEEKPIWISRIIVCQELNIERLISEVVEIVVRVWRECGNVPEGLQLIFTLPRTFFSTPCLPTYLPLQDVNMWRSPQLTFKGQHLFFPYNSSPHQMTRDMMVLADKYLHIVSSLAGKLSLA